MRDKNEYGAKKCVLLKPGWFHYSEGEEPSDEEKNYADLLQPDIPNAIHHYAQMGLFLDVVQPNLRKLSNSGNGVGWEWCGERRGF